MTTSTQAATQLDAVVIGAGIAGLYQLHKLREMGLEVKAYETGTGVGGTWYWNRYPGSRFDSQVEVYNYWFDEDLYRFWKPSERFPGQPENEKWLNWVADRLDLKKDIRFDTRIASAHYDEDTGRWLVTTADGEQIDTQYVCACLGNLKGRRVAVVGIGATGIQVIQTIAPIVGSMTVFVRTPQYIIPMKNPKYTQADWDRFSDRFHELKKRVRETFAGFDYDFDAGPWADKTPAERTAVLQRLWDDGSLALWLSSFPEMFFDEAVSKDVSDFVRAKMRARLHHDPKLCDLLIPTDYGFGTHRVPLEQNFLEAFLQDNVQAVNCRETPIECIVPDGIQTVDGKVHEADVIILAVGFDAGSGGLTRIDFRGRGGRSLKEEWSKDIRTSMGMQIHGYPNLFSTASPLAPTAALCMTTCLQQQVEWVSDCIDYARQNGKKVIEPTKEFEDSWVKHHEELANATLIVKTQSWYMGSNVEGKPRRLLSYIGGVGNFHKRCDEEAAKGYPNFAMR